MNKDLVNREFPIPGDILIFINTALEQDHEGIEGGDRATELLRTKKVSYGQLKRILHDMKMLNKEAEAIKYNLWGGQPFETWGNTVLNNERQQLKNQKTATKTAHNITGKLGTSNPFIKTHTKDYTFDIPTNPLKSNSDKTSVSKLITGKLFEEIKRIKDLM